MNNKNPGKGLEMVIQKLKFFRNWLSLPRPCKKHGRSHLFRHGNEKWECKKCWDEVHNDNGK